MLVANGLQTRSVVDYVEAKAKDARGMDVVIFRQGTERSFRLEYGPSAGGTRDAAELLAELIDMRVLTTSEPEPSGSDS